MEQYSLGHDVRGRYLRFVGRSTNNYQGGLQHRKQTWNFTWEHSGGLPPCAAVSSLLSYSFTCGSTVVDATLCNHVITTTIILFRMYQCISQLHRSYYHALSHVYISLSCIVSTYYATQHSKSFMFSCLSPSF